MSAVSDTAYYYAFSTIAQTLAAAFAFLTAFVLLRLPPLESQIRHAINDSVLFHTHVSREKLVELLRTTESLSDVITHLKSITTQISFGSSAQLPQLHFVFRKLEPLRNRMLSTLKKALYLTFGVIMVALVAIPLVSVFWQSYWLLGLLMAALIGAGLSLYLYSRLIRLTLDVPQM
jgi:hypothetical protein